MKDFGVRLVRREEILIRADSVNDVTQIACQFPLDWRALAMNRIGATRKNKGDKKRKANKWRPLCVDDEPPF